MSRDIVSSQIVYWGLVPVGGAVFDAQIGPAAMTVTAQVAGVATVTLGANNQVPILRRSVRIWSRGVLGQVAGYNEAASAVGTFVTVNEAGAQVATNIPFGFEIARVETLIGGGVG